MSVCMLCDAILERSKDWVNSEKERKVILRLKVLVSTGNLCADSSRLNLLAE